MWDKGIKRQFGDRETSNRDWGLGVEKDWKEESKQSFQVFLVVCAGLGT